MGEIALDTGDAELESGWTLRFNDGSHCIGWLGNVQVIVSRVAPSLAVMRRIIDELDQLAKTTGRGTGSLLIVRSDVSPPSDEARKFIQMELGRSSMLAAAQVVEGTGFRGATMRSVLSLLQLAARPRYPMKIFGEVIPASTWLTTELKQTAGDAPKAASLARVAAQIHRRLLQNSLAPEQ
jgi:hypothetical protein